MHKQQEDHFKNKDLHIEYIEDKSLIALQGPKASHILQNILGSNLNNLYFMQASYVNCPAIDESVLVSRCGYTGEDGFEISVSDKNAVKFLDMLMSMPDVKPCGLGARDSLRLEAGLCLYGHDMNEDITPIEASLKWVIGKRRRENGGFPGYEVIKQQIENGITKRRVGFTIEGGAPAREDAQIFYPEADGQVISVGKVSSGSYSPTLKKPIGMAYVDTKYGKLKTMLKVSVRNKMLDMKITKMPFVPQRYYYQTNLL